MAILDSLLISIESQTIFTSKLMRGAHMATKIVKKKSQRKPLAQQKKKIAAKVVSKKTPSLAKSAKKIAKKSTTVAIKKKTISKKVVKKKKIAAKAISKKAPSLAKSAKKIAKKSTTVAIKKKTISKKVKQSTSKLVKKAKKTIKARTKKEPVPMQGGFQSVQIEDLIMSISHSPASNRVDITSINNTVLSNTLPKNVPSIAATLTIAPHYVFTYWEINPLSMLEATQKVGTNANLILRYYDISENAYLDQCTFWDVEIFDRIGNWFLRLSNPSQKLLMKVGMRGQVDDFSEIIHADSLLISHQSIATPGPLKWLNQKQSDNTLTSQNQDDYIDVDTDMLKKMMGPYFYDLFMRGRFTSIDDSNIESIFYPLS